MFQLSSEELTTINRGEETRRNIASIWNSICKGTVVGQEIEALKVNMARAQWVRGEGPSLQAWEALVRSSLLLLRAAGNHGRLLSRGMA